MNDFPVSLKKREELQTRMNRLGLKEDNLVEKFIRGSGAGGQKINKTSVVVYLSHPASGINVRCQEGRSQALNRYFARRMLVEKLEEKLLGLKREKDRLKSKIRRQKKRRSRRAQEKILSDKKYSGFKKKLRSKPTEKDL
ncbi:MAG: peptide chain release factor 1 [Deltaproteobacteria bacterium RIFCSPLOWO2_12_FULL_40_28]|nr:MAG: peptide chain release factor 1 [Deltaproteobacteria bacterium RIFCSPHIGHO2_02_FULL_40_28]OGQ19353.1 MAG: peptide chain release factor 1 [Deltaproteobacteria bacterium RIFCSPHIGHO2_12_FULL_40_32]OGQ40512.1 MAG: peptide chain release factor 1 [Deltaproteobacteria bacterium RIFCSPLOWO2_02_FULL_40_36]OGQ53802.1 MAG: peptide chain release factor 1 [Deltaproteobacteria bacterium RIFCSPLOWO2_12_FULL_40_28]